MKAILAAFLLFQLGPRAPLAPAETLLGPDVLRAIRDQSARGDGRASAIPGADAVAGDILITCQLSCDAANQAMRKIDALVATKALPQPGRTIRVESMYSDSWALRTKAVIHVAQSNAPGLQVARGLWSTGAIGDEVVEILGRSTGPVEVREFFDVAQLPLDPFGVSTTTIISDPANVPRAAFVAAASAYFLATLPNAGAEALLSHLTVGAHARLAEDGRRAVSMMGNQQRASADVLITFAQAIEREQRRMRSFEKFMPTPLDPMLRSRLADMEKGITSVWTSMGITSAPFVPAAERIRGRGGEDRRVVARVGTGRLPTPEPPTALLKFENVRLVIYELGNFIDGKRSISDIRDAVSAEFGPIALPVVVDYFERLAKTGAVAIR
jgi:hypothetical protein